MTPTIPHGSPGIFGVQFIAAAPHSAADRRYAGWSGCHNGFSRHRRALRPDRLFGHETFSPTLFENIPPHRHGPSRPSGTVSAVRSINKGTPPFDAIPIDCLIVPSRSTPHTVGCGIRYRTPCRWTSNLSWRRSQCGIMDGWIKGLGLRQDNSRKIVNQTRLVLSIKKKRQTSFGRAAKIPFRTFT